MFSSALCDRTDRDNAFWFWTLVKGSESRNRDETDQNAKWNQN
jgi:hypothetical protein